ncbi:MAG: hypothetical protein DRJ42_20145 [Deltaproteobacteria bacterium]|nr:MAG: hypothetical protein DRJ42_20145 [Deltaproteobacteria bacterium]
MARPNDDYYRACEGAWRCPLDFSITDRAAFWRCRMGWLNRLRVLSLVLWPSWLGRFYLDTSVVCPSGPESVQVDLVVHTTRVSWLGLGVLTSRELIELDPDGRSFVLRGTRTMWPTFWKREPFVGPGVVDESGTRASYDFTWFGTDLKQSTVADGDLVVVTQETEWSHGVQKLVRIRASG